VACHSRRALVSGTSRLGNPERGFAEAAALLLQLAAPPHSLRISAAALVALAAHLCKVGQGRVAQCRLATLAGVADLIGAAIRRPGMLRAAAEAEPSLVLSMAALLACQMILPPPGQQGRLEARSLARLDPLLPAACACCRWLEAAPPPRSEGMLCNLLGIPALLQRAAAVCGGGDCGSGSSGGGGGSQSTGSGGSGGGAPDGCPPPGKVLLAAAALVRKFQAWLGAGRDAALLNIPGMATPELRACLEAQLLDSIGTAADACQSLPRPLARPLADAALDAFEALLLPQLAPESLAGIQAAAAPGGLLDVAAPAASRAARRDVEMALRSTALSGALAMAGHMQPGEQVRLAGTCNIATCTAVQRLVYCRAWCLAQLVAPVV